jgi:hypothetical protein
MDSLVWAKGMVEWAPISTIKGFENWPGVALVENSAPVKLVLSRGLSEGSFFQPEVRAHERSRRRTSMTDILRFAAAGFKNGTVSLGQKANMKDLISSGKSERAAHLMAAITDSSLDDWVCSECDFCNVSSFQECVVCGTGHSDVNNAESDGELKVCELSFRMHCCKIMGARNKGRSLYSMFFVFIW